MLTLRLDELVTPELVEAFQQLWTAGPAASLAQANDAMRILTTPGNEAERFVASIVLALVGPEPDAFAWLEAMGRGRFELGDAVTVTIARVKQSPAQAITRQRQRIAALAAHTAPVVERAAVENAYKDALRLLVAASLLTRMREAVATKAALGSGWAPMVAVADYCTTEEKRILFWLGDDGNFQKALGTAIGEVLARFACPYPAAATPTRDELKRQLPPNVNPYAFFREQGDKVAARSIEDRRAPRVVPEFMREPSREEASHALYRAELLMPSLSEVASGDGQANVAFALALRSRDRRLERWRYRRDGDSGLTFRAWNVQEAVWRHVRAGGFFPVELPAALVSYFEEDLAWCYHQLGYCWIGYPRWYKARFLRFDRDPTKVAKLSV